MDKFKIKAVPFLLGAYGFSYFTGTPYDFAVAATALLFLLVITKQVKLI